MTETTQVVDAGDLICNLKAAVTALECQHKMDLAREERLRRKEKKPPPPTMFVMIPIEQKTNGDSSGVFEDKAKRAKRQRHEHGRDSTEACADSISNSDSRTNGRRRDECDENTSRTMTSAKCQRITVMHWCPTASDQLVCIPYVVSSKGPTMRGGVLHSRCYCIHRDGLQDSCPLTECRGHPDCLTKPWAVCPPARYFQSRFPDNYPASPCPDAITF